MSPDHAHWPARQRDLERSLRVAAYGFAAIAGLSVLVASPALVRIGVPELVVSALGAMAAAGGTGGFVAVMADNWHVEWVSAALCAGALAAYASAALAFAALGNLGQLGVGAALACAASWFAARVVSLVVFSMGLNKVQRQSRRFRAS